MNGLISQIALALHNDFRHNNPHPQCIDTSDLPGAPPDHGARAGLHQLLPQPPPLRQDVEQLQERILPADAGPTPRYNRKPAPLLLH